MGLGVQQWCPGCHDCVRIYWRAKNSVVCSSGIVGSMIVCVPIDVRKYIVVCSSVILDIVIVCVPTGMVKIL